MEQTITVSSKQDRYSYINRIQWYIIAMLIGIALRSYITHSVTVVWIVNSIGLIVLFFSYVRFVKRNILRNAVLYFALCIVTIVVNSEYLSSSLKAIGTNINILILPVMYILSEYFYNEKPLGTGDVWRVLNFISILGILSIGFAWLTGYRDILSVFRGNLNAYRSTAYGFFYGKNIYGAFISLTLAADLYLFRQKHSFRRGLICGVKMLAIVLSFSRAALLQSAIMIFVFVWIGKKRALREWMVLFLVVVGSIIVIYTNDVVRSFLLNSVLRIDVGDAGRARLGNQAMLRVGETSTGFLFGVGYAGINALNIDVDNTYLYLFFSGGILKIVFFVLLLWLALRRIKEVQIRNKNLANLCTAVLVSYLVFAYFESVAFLELGLLNFLYTFYIFLLPNGLSVSQPTNDESDE